MPPPYPSPGQVDKCKIHSSIHLSKEDGLTTPDIHIHVHITNEPPGLDARVTALEERMDQVALELAALQTQVEEWVEDIAARIDALEEAQGTFTPEGAAAFNALKAAVEAGIATVGDADGDGNPAPAEETTP
jgi:hypothetical protein